MTPVTTVSITAALHFPSFEGPYFQLITDLPNFSSESQLFPVCFRLNGFEKSSARMSTLVSEEGSEAVSSGQFVNKQLQHLQVLEMRDLARGSA